MAFSERKVELRDFIPLPYTGESLLKLTLEDGSALFVTSDGASDRHYPLATNCMPVSIKEFVREEQFGFEDYAFITAARIGRPVTIKLGSAESTEGRRKTAFPLVAIEQCPPSFGHHDTVYLQEK